MIPVAFSGQLSEPVSKYDFKGDLSPETVKCHRKNELGLSPKVRTTELEDCMITLGLGLGPVLRSTFEYWARNLDLDLKAADLHQEFWYGGVKHREG